MSCRCSLPPSGVAVDLCVPNPGTAHLAVVSARLSGIVLCCTDVKRWVLPLPSPMGGSMESVPQEQPLTSGGQRQSVTALSLRSPSWDDSPRHTPRAFLLEVSSRVGLQVCISSGVPSLPRLISPLTHGGFPGAIFQMLCFHSLPRVCFGGSPAESLPLWVLH